MIFLLTKTKKKHTFNIRKASRGSNIRKGEGAPYSPTKWEGNHNITIQIS